MKAPLRFATRNLLFGHGPRDQWALYRLETDSYEGLTTSEKQRLLANVASFAHSVASDFTLMRVSRAWSVEDYAERARAAIDARHGHPAMWEQHLASHRSALADRAVIRPEIYLSVRLGPPMPAPVDVLGRRLADLWRGLRGGSGIEDPRALSERRLRELGVLEERSFAQVTDFFMAERATTLDLQWLIRRALCRGLGEPGLDLRFQPQALVLLDEDGGGLRYEPLEVDVLRLFESPIEIAPRGLRVRSELGESHQTLCVLGALPDTVSFPGPAAELLFAPLEGLDFPVDAVFSAEWVGNDRAAALVRRRVIDADNIYTEESHGEHGPSRSSAERPHAARVLEDYLTGQAKPPLLRATISLALGAPSAAECERRFAALQAAYAPVVLHRPFGEQRRLWLEHFPAQGTQLPEYADYLLVEQLGAMVPTATHAVGSDQGPYIGHTLSGSRQPVLFDLTEASRTSRPPATLLAGTLGSGKTMLLQLLLYQAFLQGSRIVDIDPKGDHNLRRLPGMDTGSEGNVETIELTADPTYRGLLDPLRIAPPGTAEDLTTSFLVDVLPQPVPPEWRTEIKRAVKRVAANPAPCCGQVIATLLAGGPDARKVGDSLGVYADLGLAQLGFATTETSSELAGERQVTSLRIRNLPRPLPGTPREQLTEEERIGSSILRLLAAYAMHLMGSDRSRHKVLGFDEAWFLLQDSAGRRLIEHLNRWGRSEYATPILVTHLVSDANEIDNLIGTRFIFGFESESEARAALTLLRLDPDDERLRRRLLAYRQGRCLIRDLDGRVAPVQIDLGSEELLAALDTTPRRQSSS